MPLPRNPIARAPILRKGGPHTRARSGERTRARLDLEDALGEWAEERADVGEDGRIEDDADSLRTRPRP